MPSGVFAALGVGASEPRSVSLLSMALWSAEGVASNAMASVVLPADERGCVPPVSDRTESTWISEVVLVTPGRRMLTLTALPPRCVVSMSTRGPGVNTRGLTSKLWERLRSLAAGYASQKLAGAGGTKIAWTVALLSSAEEWKSRTGMNRWKSWFWNVMVKLPGAAFVAATPQALLPAFEQSVEEPPISATFMSAVAIAAALAL